MPCPRSLRLFLLLLCCVLTTPLQARVLSARIDRVDATVAVLDDVQVRLDWPADAPQGKLTLQADRVEAVDLGYRFDRMTWQCPLRRKGSAWQCDGAIRGARGEPMRLSVALDAASTDAVLSQGDARFALQRSAASPDHTTLLLTRVPVLWAQALAKQAWADGTFTAGKLDGQLQVIVPSGQPLQVRGPLRASGLSLANGDASIAAERLSGQFTLDYRHTPARKTFALDGHLLGGEFLAGSVYVALPDAPVQLHMDGDMQAGQGLQLPRIDWDDRQALRGTASAGFSPDGALTRLQADARSTDLTALLQRYLSGPLGTAGLGDLQAQGGLRASVQWSGGRLRQASAVLDDVRLQDGQGRFRFDGLRGDVRFSADAAVDSTLYWRSSQVYGLALGESHLPIRSAQGELALQGDVPVPLAGGTLTFQDMRVRPPTDGAGLQIGFGLDMQQIDIGQLAAAAGLPAFTGQLTGHIPQAQYADERLEFDGGLAIDVFGGSAQVAALAMERPFGVAPSLSADIAFNDLDLMAMTGVFDFGSISGKLDGEIAGLRLLDWSPVAFDADLRTDPSHRIKQRISQRAVQNISSVGDASFVTSLQSRLIGLFDAFGYARIGIGCRLENEVCRMRGIGDNTGSAGSGFTIVQGSGLPRLRVVGYNRRAHWPTLVERLLALGKGEVKPVVE